MKVPAGEFLFTEGEMNDALYVVRSGKLQALRREGSKTKIIDVFLPGSMVGDLPFPANDARPYSVQALEECDLEKIPREASEAAIRATPRWFRGVLRSLLERKKRLETRSRKLSAIRTLPALLFELDHLVRTTSEASFRLETLEASLASLCETNRTSVEALARALADLGLFDLGESEIKLKKPSLISLLYDTLKRRALDGKLPPTLLSSSDQILLLAFLKASATGKLVEETFTEISGAAFKKALPKQFKVRRKIFANLSAARVLHLEPSEEPEFSEGDLIYGNVEFATDLLELNRIYPMLDHKLSDHL